MLAAKIFQPINWVGISKIIFHQVKEQGQGRKRKSSYKLKFMMTHIKDLLLQPLGEQKSKEYKSIIEKTAVGVHLNNRSILIAKNVFVDFFTSGKLLG